MTSLAIARPARCAKAVPVSFYHSLTEARCTKCGSSR